MTELKNFKEFVQYFCDERICWDYLEKKRWNDNITCIYCSHIKVYKHKDLRTYTCSDCEKQFSITKGTIFEKSRIPLTSWFAAIYLYTSHKSSVSAIQISKHLGIGKHSAWYMHHRIMEAFKVNLETKQPEHGMWEVDEVYIGPLKHRLSRTRHWRVKQGTGYIHMQGILGLLHREKGLFGMLIPDSSTQVEIQPLVKRYLDPMSVLMTDGSGVYQGLEKHFLAHERFIHAQGEYARGLYHSNTIEGAFKLFKDSIRGTYKRLGKKHLQRYWDEFCFRYNTRNNTDLERFELVFKNINRRITYKDLIKNKDE